MARSAPFLFGCVLNFTTMVVNPEFAANWSWRRVRRVKTAVLSFATKLDVDEEQDEADEDDGK